MRISGPRVFGPLTVAQDLPEHSSLFVDAFGMAELATVDLDHSSTQTLFGDDVGLTKIRLLASPGCGSGAVVCRFDGEDVGTVRDNASPVDVDALKVIDLGSANATFINGQKLIAHQARILRDGDELRLGHLVIRVHFA